LNTEFVWDREKGVRRYRWRGSS